MIHFEQIKTSKLQQTFCPKLTIKILEKGVKYAQSKQ